MTRAQFTEDFLEEVNVAISYNNLNQKYASCFNKTVRKVISRLYSVKAAPFFLKITPNAYKKCFKIYFDVSPNRPYFSINVYYNQKNTCRTQIGNDENGKRITPYQAVERLSRFIKKHVPSPYIPKEELDDAFKSLKEEYNSLTSYLDKTVMREVFSNASVHLSSPEEYLEPFTKKRLSRFLRQYKNTDECHILFPINITSIEGKTMRGGTFDLYLDEMDINDRIYAKISILIPVANLPFEGYEKTVTVSADDETLDEIFNIIYDHWDYITTIVNRS